MCFSVSAGYLDHSEIQAVSADRDQEMEHMASQWELGRLGDVPSPTQSSEAHQALKTSLLGRDIYFLFYHDTKMSFGQRQIKLRKDKGRRG